MKITGIASFGDAHVSIGFDVTPQQAVDYFRSKGLRESFNYDDLLAEEHAAAFTVAKMADIDLLRDVHESLQQALQDGMRFQDWADMLRPTLQAKGWWGRKAVRDPVTGATVVSELGSARRLETIFRTNMQSAYAVGQWQQIKAQQADAPYLMYDAVDDYRTRAQHAAWDNKVLPVSSQWWDTHSPPNGYNCRCSLIQLDAQDVESMGLTVGRAPRAESHPWKNPRTGQTEQIPAGVDPQFAHNPGQSRHEQLQKIAKEKISQLPQDLQDAANTGLQPPPGMFGPPRELDTLIDRLKKIAGTVTVDRTVPVDGLRAFTETLEDVHQRFGLEQVAVFSDYRKTKFKKEFPETALAGYVPRDDLLMFRELAMDLAKASELDAQDIAQAFTFNGLVSALAGQASKEVEAVLKQMGNGLFRHSIGNHPSVVAAHEYGHRVHTKYFDKLDKLVREGYSQGWSLAISQYSCEMPQEFMAESFALYITGDPSEHVRIYPPLLQAFRELDANVPKEVKK